MFQKGVIDGVAFLKGKSVWHLGELLIRRDDRVASRQTISRGYGINGRARTQDRAAEVA